MRAPAALARIAAFAPALVPQSALAQRLGGAAADTGLSPARVLAALAVCLAAAFAMILVIRARRGGSRAWSPARLAQSLARQRRVEVIEARRLSAFADVCLIRCDGSEYLLLCGPSGQTVLDRSASREAPADAG